MEGAQVQPAAGRGESLAVKGTQQWDRRLRLDDRRGVRAPHRLDLGGTRFSGAVPRSAQELPLQVQRARPVEPPSREVQDPSPGPQSPTPADRLRAGAEPQFSPDRKWWWTGTDWVSADATQGNRETAAGSNGENLRERALEVESTHGSDALTLKEIRLLHDPKRRRRQRREPREGER